MKFVLTEKNELNSLILIVFAVILLIIAFATNRHDLTTATVIISATILFLTGVLLLNFNKKDLIEGRVASLLHVQGTINVCRIASDMGIMGHAVLIPEKEGNYSKTMQFIPVSVYKNGELIGDSFVSGPGGTGILIVPPGEPLLNELKQNADLRLPNSDDELISLISSIGEDTLELAEHVSVSKNGDGYLITLSDYYLLQGCLAVFRESPACCLMNPCPVCSLFGMILAEGLTLPFTLERCIPDENLKTVEMNYVPVTYS